MILKIAGMVLALSLMSAAHSSDMVYEQTPSDADDTVLVNSNNLANFKGSIHDVHTYDNFTLEKAAVVAAVSWRGASSDAALNGFIITLYPSTLDRFPAPDMDKPMAITWIEGAGDEKVLGNGLSDFNAALSSPVQLNADIQYWLSIVAVRRDFTPWGWASARSGDLSSLQVFKDLKILPVTTDRAFCLKSAVATEH